VIMLDVAGLASGDTKQANKNASGSVSRLKFPLRSFV